MGAEPLVPASSRPGAEHATVGSYYLMVAHVRPIGYRVVSNSHISNQLTLWPKTTFPDEECDDEPSCCLDVDEMIVSCRGRPGYPKEKIWA